MPRRFQGSQDATGLRFALVVSQFHPFITQRLEEAAIQTLAAHGAVDSDLDVYLVPGAFEIPVLARAAAESGRYDAVICLGAVIQGETDHYRLVAEASAHGIARVALDTGVPCIFEVLATPTVELALARAGGDAGNKGEEAALAAVRVARVLAEARNDAALSQGRSAAPPL